MKTKLFIISLLGLLLVSIFFNIKPDKDDLWFVSFPDANTRPTFDTFHHIKEAQHYATGKGIKIGIIGKYFGYMENILPTGLFPGSPESYSREADLNVYHFDYNVLLLFKYKDFVNSGRKVTNNIGNLPYFSNSSMSPVLAGIVAMLKELNNNLSVSDYKKILMETSLEIEYNGYKVNHVVDAKRAVDYLLNKYKEE